METKVQFPIRYLAVLVVHMEGTSPVEQVLPDPDVERIRAGAMAPVRSLTQAA